MVAYKSVEGKSLQFMPIRVQVKNLRNEIADSNACLLLHTIGKEDPILPSCDIQIGMVMVTGRGGTDMTDSQHHTTSQNWLLILMLALYKQKRAFMIYLLLRSLVIVNMCAR